MNFTLSGVVCIGNPHGRVALFLDETDCHDLAAKFPWPDLAYEELMNAAELAYPDEAGNE